MLSTPRANRRWRSRSWSGACQAVSVDHGRELVQQRIELPARLGPVALDAADPRAGLLQGRKDGLVLLEQHVHFFLLVCKYFWRDFIKIFSIAIFSGNMMSIVLAQMFDSNFQN